jgi:hypothetical protein
MRAGSRPVRVVVVVRVALTQADIAGAMPAIESC